MVANPLTLQQKNFPVLSGWIGVLEMFLNVLEEDGRKESEKELTMKAGQRCSATGFEDEMDHEQEMQVIARSWHCVNALFSNDHLPVVLVLIN